MPPTLWYPAHLRRSYQSTNGQPNRLPETLSPNPEQADRRLLPAGRAVLCLHGFSGSPFEIQPIVEQLNGAGYRAEAPLLAGHGLDVSALENTGWRDWLRSAEQAFDALAAETPGRIAVMGFSMGALLALKLAASRPERVAAVAVLAAPLRLRPAQIRGIQILGRVPRVLRWGPFRAIPKLRRSNTGLRAMPLAGLQSLLELMTNARQTLGDIRAPALVIHGRKDRTVPIAASFELADLLAASEAGGAHRPIVERLWLDRSHHQVGIGVEHAMVGDAVSHFLAGRGQW
jgi:carboxylesterase